MTVQLTLEDALAARDVQLERVDTHADPAWKDRALEAVRQVCLARPEWHSDDVWALTGLDEPREARALGPVMMRAARLGWCQRTDRTRPSVRSHGSPKPLWKSNLYAGQGSAA